MADHLRVILNTNYVPGSTINALNGNSLTLVETNANQTILNGTNGANGTDRSRNSKSPSPSHCGIGAYQNNTDV